MSFFSQLPLVVSYYTKGTPYEEEVKNLISSCERFGIECHVEGVEDLGSWEENCALKPYFIRDVMNKEKRPLLWVDADAVFLKPMVFEEFMFSDLSLLKYEEDTDIRFCVAAGTVFINATEGGRQALDLWCHYADQIRQMEGKAPAFMDQVSLYLVFLSKPPISLALLPVRYCKIFDRPIEGLSSQDVVVEHRQASRRFKKTHES
jgi:hypothetical protein